MTNPTITRLLMQICATRLDSSVSADAFVEQLEDLIDVTMAPAEPEEPVTAPAQPELWHAPRWDALCTPTPAVEAEEVDHVEALVEVPVGPPAPPAPPRRSRNRRLKISYDNRVRIRMQADKALDENGGRMPRGFVSNLAGEWNVSDQTIYNILSGER